MAVWLFGAPAILTRESYFAPSYSEWLSVTVLCSGTMILALGFLRLWQSLHFIRCLNSTAPPFRYSIADMFLLTGAAAILLGLGRIEFGEQAAYLIPAVCAAAAFGPISLMLFVHTSRSGRIFAIIAGLLYVEAMAALCLVRFWGTFGDGYYETIQCGLTYAAVNYLQIALTVAIIQSAGFRIVRLQAKSN